jgi:hypothetical protein
MKSISTIESVKWLSRYDGPNRRGGSFPRIKTNYQTRFESAKSSAASQTGTDTPNLSGLANQVLGESGDRSFAPEAIFFAFIVLLMAWPIASMIWALALK